ncbi:ATP-binding protein [Aeromicrobium sp. IC_218]|uniref:sensor histidine kinase n=1 Tax=Aeromicrobium sp. IC_218 TaxID=2545468 RepID=UPI00103D9BB4|nr:ATP-binding protein [Aeromicrobium sp. IC_218]TCI99086.1 two-component sensor histidine kinase [Aeromicrobium sp. IC_218]
MELSTELVITAFLGALVGAVITYVWRLSERRLQEVPSGPTPVSPVPPGAEAVLSVLSSSAVLLDDADVVLQASAPAYALGLVREDELTSEALLQLVRQVRRDGQVREGETTLHRRGRAPVHVHARVAPLTRQVVLVLVQDRTHEHRVETIRRDFVANVSHELKTPIGAISLLAEAVGEAKDDPEAVVRFAGRMQDEGRRLTRLVQQIIDLSRLQADVLNDTPDVVAVGDLVAEACEHSQTDAEAKGIELVRACEPGLFLRGDRSQVHAAVSNLVENAVTYSEPGTRVSVTAEAYGDDVRITVTDRGIGIPEGELDRIFERFYRVDPARHRSTGGTGLGLSIVKHVAASNGGSVEVWSKPDEGSSFTLVLPAHVPDNEEEHA